MMISTGDYLDLDLILLKLIAYGVNFTAQILIHKFRHWIDFYKAKRRKPEISL